MSWLINAAQLDRLRKNPKNVVILDASGYYSDKSYSAEQAFFQSHIAGARFLDFNRFHDKHSSLPNMLSRDEVVISDNISKLGITSEHKIVLYDRDEQRTSCRAAWMFKVFGHHASQLFILDGGYASWEKYGGKVSVGEPASIPVKPPYPVNYEARYIRTLLQMKANLHHLKEQVIDVRHAVRFAGGPEPRPGLRHGHLPDSFSFPFSCFFESTGEWKSLDKIRKQLLGICVDLDKPIIATCGSGVTAAILDFTLDLLNHDSHAVYDGSWVEWGAEVLYPGEESLSERPVKTSL